tara:strand:- start:9563 stop:9730 length:168 start_codon:yes stop_codon:yes gene_type:complete
MDDELEAVEVISDEPIRRRTEPKEGMEYIYNFHMAWPYSEGKRGRGNEITVKTKR